MKTNISTMIFLTIIGIGYVTTSLSAVEKQASAKQRPHAAHVLKESPIKVGFIDSYTVMGTCQEGQKARAEVENKQKEFSAAIAKEEQKIQQAVAAYKEKTTMLSEAAREKEEKALLKMERDYKANIQDKEEELKIEMQTRTEKLARNMDDGVKAMAEENGLDVVFDRITGRAIYVSDSYDMTKKAVASVDKEYTVKLAQEKAATAKQTTVVAQT